jgi:hypothetical protein
MIQLEGPIVDSIYDMALISWNKKLEPPLPCLTNTEKSREYQHVKLSECERASESQNHQVGHNALGRGGRDSRLQQPNTPQATSGHKDPVGDVPSSRTGMLHTHLYSVPKSKLQKLCSCQPK